MATAPDNQNSGFGANDWLIEEMYEQYQANPASVDASWVAYFKANPPKMSTDAAPAPASAPASPAAPAAPAPAAAAPAQPVATTPAKPGANEQPKTEGVAKTGSSVPVVAAGTTMIVRKRATR